MSADVLREAARLMRERAEAAAPGLWVHDTLGAVRSPALPTPSGGKWAAKLGGCVVNRPSVSVAPGRSEANAEHIASWHPAVALAVADWLDMCAGHASVTTSSAAETCVDYALAVARAYLAPSRPAAAETAERRTT